MRGGRTRRFTDDDLLERCHHESNISFNEKNRRQYILNESEKPALLDFIFLKWWIFI